MIGFHFALIALALYGVFSGRPSPRRLPRALRGNRLVLPRKT